MDRTRLEAASHVPRSWAAANADTGSSESGHPRTVRRVLESQNLLDQGDTVAHRAFPQCSSVSSVVKFHPEVFDKARHVRLMFRLRKRLRKRVCQLNLER